MLVHHEGYETWLMADGRESDNVRKNAVFPRENVPYNKNIAKGTTDPRVEFISQVLTQFLMKFQFQKLD